MHINKAYLVWLMFRVPSNQHYQHRTNQKLRSWANAVFQNRGVCGQAVPSFPSPSPVIPFFCSRPDILDELARKRLLRRLDWSGLLDVAGAFIWFQVEVNCFQTSKVVSRSGRSHSWLCAMQFGSDSRWWMIEKRERFLKFRFYTSWVIKNCSTS